MNTNYANIIGFPNFFAFSRKSIQQIFITFLVVFALVPFQINGQSTSTVFNTAGVFTWTAPAGVTSINVQLWGGGGGGAATGVANGSGGGGGGAFTNSTIAVTPGTTYTLQVGAGGAKGTGCATPTDGTDGTNSWFNDSTTLFANAGKGGKAPVGAAGLGGLGGTATSGAGITSYSGGDGSVGGTSIVLGPGGGGGGGSSAGTSANGVNGSPAVITAAQTLGGGGGIAPPGGGYGGQGGGYNNMNGLLNGVDGFAPGGGGGGAGNGSNPSCIGLNTDGGNGAHGRVIITTGQTIFTQTGSWTAPACISSVIVEAWAGGGAGGGNETTDDGGGGGGGGAYSKSVVTVTPGQTYAVTVGTGGVGVAGGTGTNGGDSWFINATTILAKGGTGGNPPIAGASGIPGLGGSAAAGIGTTKYSGGDGGLGNDAPVGFGGGGGSSAGYTANGTVGGDANALATVIIPAPGGIAPNGGGDGGDGQNTLLSGNGYSGFTPGGGGGGSSDIEVAPGVSGGAGAGGKIILSYPDPSLVIGDNPVPAADVCANAVNVPIHGFTLTGANGCSTETDIRFTTTGTYTAPEILNYKLYYTTTNVFATTNYLVTVSSSTGVGVHAFPSISRITGGPIYYWITMDVASTVVDGHTLGVNGTTPADITASPTATGSSVPSGTQTLKSAPVLNSTLTPSPICSGTTFTYSPTSVTPDSAFTWTRATVPGIAEAGTSNSGNVNETLTNTTANPINVTYVYVTTSTANTCVNTSGENVTVAVNPSPQGSISGNTICGADPSSLGQLTWVSTAGTGPYTLIYDPGAVTESGVTSGTSFSVTPNPATTTTYTVLSVTDANGCQRTSNFTRDTASIIATSSPIVITQNPTDTAVCDGDDASFTVSGTGIYSYGWEVSTDNGGIWTDVTIAAGAQPTYSNATTSTLNLSATTTAHDGYVYRAVLSPACGAVVTTSGTATLTINPLPVLSNSSSSATVCSGTIFTYTPTSTTGGATFTWTRATVPGITEPGTFGTPDINEALTNETNTPIDVTYTVVITASGCSDPAGENITLTVEPSPVLNSSLTPAAICSREIFTYSPTSASLDSSFTWTRATKAGIAEAGKSGVNNIIDTLTNTTSSPIDVKYHYITTSANCSVGGAGDSVTVTVNPDATITLTSAIETDSQSVCVNTPIADITYSVGGSGINAAASGLPPGVNGVFNAGVFTISGTPNVSGVFNYTVNTSGICVQDTITGTIVSGISLITPPGTNDQNVCLNTPIANIDYAIGGAGQSAVVTGLPDGVSGGFSAPGVFTISGTPSVCGGFDYTVSTTGSCAVSTATGTINVGLSLISAVGTDSQAVCLNEAITNIVYNIVGGDVPPPTVSGLPNGVTGALTAPGIFTISGTPILEGFYTYTVTAQGTCTSPANLTGTIMVGLGRVSLAGTDSQVVCRNTPITAIDYTFSGGATPVVTGLPNGVTDAINSGRFTISGTPSIEGTYTYTISTQGTCAAPAQLTGRIIVGIGLVSAPQTDTQNVCLNAPITPIVYSVAGGDVPPPIVTGLPASFTRVISNGIFTISGSSSVSGLFNYTVTAQGSCASSSRLYGRILVGIGLTSATGTDTAQVLCKSTSPITPIVYSIVGGGVNTATGLPPGVTGTTTTPGDPAIFTISGTPNVAGTYNYLVTSTGGTCPPTGVAGKIVVNETTISPSSAPGTTNQTICSNTAITNVTYVIGGVGTGATVSNLPPGLTSSYNEGILTISGTPNAQLQAGTYTYTVTTTGVCTQSSSVFTLTILHPIANFSADTLIGVSPLLVNFTNESVNANIYNWDLGTDSLVSGVEHPSNGYITPGTYTVILTASKDGLCPDTASAIVIINENFSILIPNVFTPNGDNINDFFTIPSTDVERLDVEIFDRWGLKLFEYHTIYGGWDGRSAKTGIECTDGIYYYIIYAKGYNGSEVKKTGAFTLIR